MNKILKKNNKDFELFIFLLSFIITLGTGFIASIFGRNSKQIYDMLEKPFFAPPPWVFSVVWPILYILMAYALFRIWSLKNKGEDVRGELKTYFIQLILNLLWTVIFFYLNLRFIAFLEIILLLVSILMTMIKFYKKDKLAGILFIPYFIWVVFAAVLNFAIWFINA